VSALNKIILKTAVAGLVWTAVVFCYGLGIFAMSFPGAMARFYDTVGDKPLGAMYHERVYKRNPTPENLYTTLDKFIQIKNHDKVIKYSEKMFKHKDYDRTVNNINKFVRDHSKDVPFALELACNADNYLRCSYIEALLAKGRKPEANQVFEKAISTIDVSRPSYAYFSLSDEQYEQDFRDYFDEYKKLDYTVDDGIYEAMAKYFERFVEAALGINNDE